jgi:glycosyltransferase involved in cell wall biosynthesis
MTIEKPNVLWVSLMAPYDNVRHASGKTQNFYLKKLHNLNLFNFYLLSLCKSDEKAELDCNRYGIKNNVYIRNRLGVSGVVSRGVAWLSEFCVYNRYAGFTPIDVHRAMRQMLSYVKEENFNPQIIILDWTQMLFLLPSVKELFPRARIVAIEEDVSFLGAQRKAEIYRNLITRKLWAIKSRRIKELELRYLMQCDLVILNNYKDQKLIEDNGISHNNWICTPFFQSMLSVPRNQPDKIVLFYGAMFRVENWKSAIWFIENVFPFIEDNEVQFWVVGNRPPKRLLKYADARIKILGFVQDITPLFQKSLCLAAPLVLGAGVKVKVLAGLSAGIPVLTNKIGIEGIGAHDKKEFFLCETAEQYITTIEGLLTGQYNQNEIAKNAKSYIASNYDMERDVSIFADKLNALLEES